MSDPAPFTEQGYIAGGLRGAEAQRRILADVPPGLHVSRRSLPPGLVVIEDYLPALLREQLVEYARAQQGRPSTVQAAGAGAGKTLTRLSADRVTDYIEIDGVAPQVHALMRDIFTQQVGRHFGTAIEWYEKPEILRYRAGGHYSPHADAENWDPASHSWSRAVDRDFSILLYLNDDYTGGHLEFANFGLRLSPKAGMLVAFPSDHRFLHCALPTQEGERLVLVCWCAARASQRVGNGPPQGATVIADDPLSR